MTLRTGLLLLPSRPVPEMAALAARAEALGYDDVWLADERFFREVYAALTVFTQWTRRVRLGPCVTDPYSRHPALTAMAIATLDEIAGGRAVLGFGAGVSGFAELGIDSSKSATAIREGIAVVRRLLAGETVTVKGEQVSIHEGRLDWAPARADIPIYVASQRAAGCRVAGRVADGAIMQGALAEPLVRFLRDTVHGAAREAGRDPTSIELVARLNTCIHDDRGAARDVMRPTLVRSLAAQRKDFFTFVTAGLSVPRPLAEKLRGLAYTHDVAPLRALAPEIPDEFVDACTLTGPPAVVASEVVRLARSGISQVMIYPLAVGGGPETTVERFQREVMPLVRRELHG
jgi:5,10-methylenetetrahydromethanopterin reductase